MKLPRFQCLSILKKLYQDFPFEEELFEMQILRDVLAHNHLLEVSYSWDDEKGMTPTLINRRSPGDKKYEHHVDTTANLTKKLHLNVSPVKVGRRDAIFVLQTMWNILLFLEEKDSEQCYVSQSRATHKGKRRRFGEIVDMLESGI